MVVIMSNELYHHGILGQKWGKRNGPPYPLDASDHSASEKKAGWRKSLKKDEEEKSSVRSKTQERGQKAADSVLKNQGKEKVRNEKMNAQKLLNLSDEDYRKAKKIAAGIGIGLGTAAGIYALNCALGSKAGQEMIAKGLDDLGPEDYTQVLQNGLNNDPTHPEAFDLDDSLFRNQYNDGGDYVGDKAREAGYEEIHSSILDKAIANRADSFPLSEADYDNLAMNVRKNVETIYPRGTHGRDRRLSCWSGSNAYFFSALTGNDFVSKNFQNAVDFNKFGKLYKEPPKVFDVFGNPSSSYVGTFGKVGTAAKPEMADTLVRSILKTIDKSYNTTPDGSRTVGFINGGHHSFSCPHQWNFEVKYNKLGGKELMMVDGYHGVRYPVARMNALGKIRHDLNGIDKFREEISSYNDDSLRFYAPSLDSVNTDVSSRVILGKT